MSNTHRSTKITVCLVLSVLLVASPSAYALRIGWNVDIHQNKFADYANDFHIWGILESGDETGSNPPTFTSEVNFLTSGPPLWTPGATAFENFNYQIGGAPTRPLPPGSPWPGPPDPEPPFYYFEGSWSTAGQIPYCQWVHFGLEFDEDCHNIGYWLQGVWTKDGIDPAGNPIYGFEVEDGILTGLPQRITIQNASGTETVPLQMDMMILSKEEGEAFPLGDLNTGFFDQNPEWNERWVAVPPELLPDVLPGDGGPDSFFDVFLEQVPGLGQLGPEEVLLARQHSEYYMSNPGWENFWQYEIHGSHIPEPVTLGLIALGAVGLIRRRR